MVLCMRKVFVRLVQVLCINGIAAAENVTKKVKKWQKIAILWLFFVSFWPFRSHFQLLWSCLCIKLAPSTPKPSSHIGPLMRQPFFPVPGTYPGIQGPKNGYFLAKSGPNGPGRLQARPVHLERAWCAISHPNWWESIAWGHFCQFQAPIQASRAPKIAIFG